MYFFLCAILIHPIMLIFYALQLGLLQEHNSQIFVAKVRFVGDFINKVNPEFKQLPLHLSDLSIFNFKVKLIPFLFQIWCRLVANQLRNKLFRVGVELEAWAKLGNISYCPT